MKGVCLEATRWPLNEWRAIIIPSLGCRQKVEAAVLFDSPIKSSEFRTCERTGDE